MNWKWKHIFLALVLALGIFWYIDFGAGLCFRFRFSYFCRLWQSSQPTKKKTKMKELRAYANDERNPTMADMVDVRACVWFQSTSEMFSTYDSTCWPPDQQQSALDFEEEEKNVVQRCYEKFESFWTPPDLEMRNQISVRYLFHSHTPRIYDKSKTMYLIYIKCSHVRIDR